MLFNAVHIQDDRGRRVRVVGHRVIYLLRYRAVLLSGRGDTDLATQRRAQKIIAGAQRHPWSDLLTCRGILAIAFWVVWLLGVLFLLWHLPIAVLTRLDVFVLSVLLANLPGAAALCCVSDRTNAPRVRTALLVERFCPSCAYDLANSPRDPDGLTPCPECGAAWRV